MQCCRRKPRRLGEVVVRQTASSWAWVGSAPWDLHKYNESTENFQSKRHIPLILSSIRGCEALLTWSLWEFNMPIAQPLVLLNYRDTACLLQQDRLFSIQAQDALEEVHMAMWVAKYIWSLDHANNARKKIYIKHRCSTKWSRTIITVDPHVFLTDKTSISIRSAHRNRIPLT